jgi:hypothetical protein
MAPRPQGRVMAIGLGPQARASHPHLPQEYQGPLAITDRKRSSESLYELHVLLLFVLLFLLLLTPLFDWTYVLRVLILVTSN